MVEMATSMRKGIIQGVENGQQLILLEKPAHVVQFQYYANARDIDLLCFPDLSEHNALYRLLCFQLHGDENVAKAPISIGY